jgi:hypothetical protein
MRIEPNMALKQTYIKHYWRVTRNILALCRQGVSDYAEHTDPERLKGQVERLLNVKPMETHLNILWGDVGGKFAYDTSKLIASKKNSNVTLELKVENDKLKAYQERMKAYAAERSLQKAKAIMSTESEAINKVIDDVIQRGFDEGLSIPKVRALLKDELSGDTMTTIENFEAERIARTEVNSASNTGSFEAATEGDTEGVKKAWLSSGLPGVRPTHQEYEAMGVQELDYEYNAGLQYPGDPGCDIAEDVINCRCTIVYETE